MSFDPLDLIGRVIGGQFRADALAGDADLTVVYRGRRLDANLTVAIKCLRLPETIPDPLARALDAAFYQAYRVHDRLARGNANIAQTITSGEMACPGNGAAVPYLVREWLEGESLASELAGQRAQARPARPIEEVLGLLEGAFEAVAFAHAQGEVHLGINPCNLFVATGPGGAVTLKVLDFGLARMMTDFAPESPSESHSGCGLRLFLPGYAAPEQLDETLGAAGPQTDVYALALVAMEALSGHKLPSYLEQVLDRALSAAPAARHRNAGELWSEMRSAVVPRSPSAAAMLAGGASPTPAVVVGAVAKPRLKASSDPCVDTQPMRFEAGPPSSEHVYGSGERAEGEASPLAVERAALPLMPDPRDRLSMSSSQIPSLVPPVIAVGTDAHSGRLGGGIPRLFSRRPGALAAGAAALVLGVVGTTAVLRSHRSPEAGQGASVASAAVTSAAAPSPEGHSTGPAAAAAPGSLPGSSPPSASNSAAANTSAAPFVPGAARRAIDLTKLDVAKCRRGKSWGYAFATVTFTNDGAVDGVAIAPPLAGTPTGACVADVLATVRIAPFEGASRSLSYKFYVSPK
jgi:serine/threonine protein kinase